ncbi:LysR family transcriptional regulator [Plantactinospora sp. GCM10030261]|uniref:LysR family transcriptional regulator n=1 Tax=Plantactinospora sp. GCM10030261 TaxID=3273420 RepID=UPI003611024A
MRIDPRRLAVLGAVADAGGVLAAAAVLHLTPSAVSQHISRLEAETGVTLLDRSQLGGRRAARLTPAGRLLAAHASRVAEALAAAERDLAALTGAVTGVVRVGAFPTAIRHLVGPAMAAIAAGPARVEVRVQQVERQPGLASVRAGGLDLLVAEGDPDRESDPMPGLRVDRLLDDPYRVVFPPRWAPVGGIEALLARPWVDGTPGTAVRAALDRIAVRYGVVPASRHECLEFPAALSLVAAGVAAAVVPALALPADGPIEVLEVPGAGARRIELVCRGGRTQPSPAADLVAQAIHAAARR